ncbi:hypothetical protein Pint_05547 [Pistacia integerrima]|uniref:Uncharacterized protein n=1 Tax=Pistacia integerrima TaxID=434235 RepID=A0ACC0Z8I5_9ROSI|nr:hypothetical protein Pint_05547 [Pistacia integerrima]
MEGFDDMFVKKICREQCDIMSHPISNEEIKVALFDIGDEKAPRLNGYSTKFFQAAWNTIGEEVSRAVSDFFLQW